MDGEEARVGSSAVMGYKTDPIPVLERRLESWRECLRTGKPRSEVKSAPGIIRELEAEIERRKIEFTGRV